MFSLRLVVVHLSSVFGPQLFLEIKKGKKQRQNEQFMKGQEERRERVKDTTHIRDKSSKIRENRSKGQRRRKKAQKKNVHQKHT